MAACLHITADFAPLCAGHGMHIISKLYARLIFQKSKLRPQIPFPVFRLKLFRICWKRQSKQTSGYQITYSGARYPHLSPNLNRVRIKNARATTHKIKISSTAYRYRVWIRTYKKVGSNYYFSDWSEYFSIWRDGTLER